MASNIIDCRKNILQFSNSNDIDYENNHDEEKNIYIDRIKIGIFFESLKLVLATIVLSTILFLAFDNLIDMILAFLKSNI